MTSRKEHEKFEDMEAFRDEFNDMPDGAFFALAAERGYTVEDWAWFSDQCDRRRKKKVRQ